MTYRELENKVIDAIRGQYGTREASAIQRFLFADFTGMDSASYLLKRQEEAGADFEDKILKSIPQLIDFVPVQYITGRTWFCGLELRVSPAVLIPRPETEELVNKIIEKHKGSPARRILDIGTGSGAIAVSLGHYLQDSTVVALDISKEALEQAKTNAELHLQKIRFIEASILDKSQLEDLPEFDIIVSNPPYVRESERKNMLPNVLEYEPGLALFVTDADPLIFYRAIIAFAKNHQPAGGELWFEFNESEAGNMVDILSLSGFKEITVYSDMHSKPRFLSCLK